MYVYLRTHDSTEMCQASDVDTEIHSRAIAEVVLAAPPKPARPWPCPRSKITHQETGETGTREAAVAHRQVGLVC